MDSAHDAAAAIMRAQHGVLGRRQAHAAGLTDRQIGAQLNTRRWSKVFPGVYAAAASTLTWSAWAHALVLAAGARAVLLGGSAATLRELTPQRFPITVAIPRSRRSDLRSGRLRLLRLDVPDTERVTIAGLPTTTRLRTASDVAHLVPLTEAQPIVDRMLVLGQVDLEPLTATVNASRRAGSKRARQLMASAADGAAAESERIVRRLLREAGLTGWVSNYEVTLGGRKRKLDLALKRLKIGIEVKGWVYHSLADRAAADDRRVVDMQLSDWIVIPVGWLALNTDPEGFVNQVRAAIAFREAQNLAS